MESASSTSTRRCISLVSVSAGNAAVWECAGNLLLLKMLLLLGRAAQHSLVNW